jgi:hypothetical protein
MKDEELRNIQANCVAKRTLTQKPIDPSACDEGTLSLAGTQTRRITGHLIPVDGGLTEVFLPVIVG